ncbi:P-loop NTPase fold protein [Streptococcus sp. NLN76]|uniref:KAP family P-loop NTPase fold protein n=1 Tax=Streptococcus sp. NLN76 TaxID=2822800 RepID=UPI0018AA18B8|nr:P-loop NTPase fold protein [Streptococcus sp. NLN76]MBF8970558.1 AAA family ATPase [Streptococcus sp. NLN76]
MEKKLVFSAHSDSPAIEDSLNIQQYIDGLYKFVKNCETPLSMSIQGDWGSGKTSVMQLLKEKIKSENPNTKNTIWFNTWQFTQFDLSPLLPVHFITDLLNVLVKEGLTGSTELIERIHKTIKSTFKVLRLLPFSNITAVTEELYDEFFTPDSENKDSGLRDLKENFQSLINDFCSQHHVDRLFFFIDDLDRVEPQYALELMEAIKLFLDCKQCVFIIAIDHEVVNTALEKKYPNLSQTKRDSFFDKLIQVPFTVPINNYDISKYIEGKLQKLGIKETTEDADSKEIVEILKYSVGGNPRSINRAINNYSLQIYIKNSTSTSQQGNPNSFDRSLFILTCMRYAFPAQFDELEQDPDAFLENLEANLESQNPSSTDSKYDDFLQFFLKEYGIKYTNSKQIDEKTKDDVMERLKNDLQFSSISSKTPLNSNSLTLVERQEKFWSYFKTLLNKEITTDTNSEFTESMTQTGGGKHPYLSLNHKSSSKIIELRLNRKSIGIIVGISNKNRNSDKLIEKVTQSLDETIRKLRLNNTDKNNEIETSITTNHTGYIVKNNSLGLDFSNNHDISEWYFKQIHEGLEELRKL